MSWDPRTAVRMPGRRPLLAVRHLAAACLMFQVPIDRRPIDRRPIDRHPIRGTGNTRRENPRLAHDGHICGCDDTNLQEEVFGCH